MRNIIFNEINEKTAMRHICPICFKGLKEERKRYKLHSMTLLNHEEGEKILQNYDFVDLIKNFFILNM